MEDLWLLVCMHDGLVHLYLIIIFSLACLTFEYTTKSKKEEEKHLQFVLIQANCNMYHLSTNLHHTNTCTNQFLSTNV